MDKETILSLLATRCSLKDPAIEKLGTGAGNENYRVHDTDMDIDVVARIARDDISLSEHRESRLYNEHRTLKFLEYRGFTHAPRSVLYDPENRVHVVTFIEGEDVYVGDFSDSQLREFITHVARLYSLKHDETFVAFCEAENLDVPKPMTAGDLFKIFYKDRVKYIRDHCGNVEYMTQIEQHLKRAEVLLEQMQAGDMFWMTHGDLGGNIRLSDQGMYFIDWEFSRFSNLPEIRYIIDHGTCSEKQATKLMTMYSDMTGMHMKDLRRVTELQAQQGRIGDIIWALKRYCESLSVESLDADEYKRLVDSRIKIYEESYGKNN